MRFGTTAEAPGILQRLDDEGIEPGRAQLAGSQGGDQGIFVHKGRRAPC